MKFLSGDDEGGAAYLEEAMAEYPSFSLLSMARPVHELDCADRLSGKLAGEFLGQLEAEKDHNFQPFLRLLHARLLFRRSKPEEAMHETDEILTFSRLHKNKLHLVEAGLLKVLMLQKTGENADAQRKIQNLLREAIHYAYANRILMPFFLDRKVLLPLLQELSAQAVGKNALPSPETSFLRDTIAICGQKATPEKAPDILSARELEVLGELSLGLTNREIAEKLCISQATVKTHVLSIFGKLGVCSRMMAVQEGRTRGLLSQKPDTLPDGN